jgi:uncharacterized protein (TIGR02594 family)
MIDPRWLAYARRFVGLREIPGPRHEPRILAMAARVKNWLGIIVNDDEVPWCGTFMADVMLTGAGINPPRIAVRAMSWATWGVETSPRLGAVLVFKRPGGGHVGLYVGETSTHYRVLGGNQSNAVTDNALIAKSRLVACRWPVGEPQRTRPVHLVGVDAGVISENEG